jgi:1,2-diacylglycerol 3-beta-glucosyltransferase
MVEVIEWSSALAALALLPFYLLLLAVLVASLRGRHARGKGKALPPPDPPRFLIVIPAHDEETLIASTIRSCRGLDYDPARASIHVIADNCSDQTAGMAREAGATVFERFDPDLKSKGHALEAFFAAVPEARPDSGDYDAAVIVDADTRVDPDALNVFASALARGQDWIQAYYTVSNADASWRTRLMTYAFSLANGVWMLGLDRLGLGVGLKGNGMCFSRRGLRRFPWKAYGLVEDMEFALMLRSAGERVHFRRDAVVYGEMVSRGGEAATSQRLRWEAGRKSLRAKFRRPLWESPHLGLPAKLAYLVDLYFPPLGQLVIATIFPTSMLLGCHFASGGDSFSRYLLLTYGALWLILGVYAVSPVFIVGLPWRYLFALWAAPRYLAWKILKIVGRTPRAWVRTPRES